MIRISAFADEIALDPNEQVAVLQEEHITFIDLRAAWGTNVLDFTDEQVTELQRILKNAQIGVAAIGSPLGKVPIDSDHAEQMRRLDRAIALAQTFGTRYIRIFSFYPPAHTHLKTIHPDSYREEVLRRLKDMTERARQENIVLIHENEKDIYGDTIQRNVEILEGINDPHFRSVLDPANYLQCEQEPYPTAYEATRPWLEYVHVKDVSPDGTLVVAGEGAGHWPALLRRLRADHYDGFLTLEPHLSAAGQYQGFSGPDLFRQAARALQGLLTDMQWEYA
jgi:sugar phosphate isomerase/epimerase